MIIKLLLPLVILTALCGFAVGQPGFALGFVAAVVLFTVPAYAFTASPRRKLYARTLSLGGALACISVLMVLTVSTFERVYLINARSYPAWLTAGNLGKLDANTTSKLRNERCTEPLEILKKEDGYVVRCGVWLWLPSTHTWKADSVAD